MSRGVEAALQLLHERILGFAIDTAHFHEVSPLEIKVRHHSLQRVFAQSVEVARPLLYRTRRLSRLQIGHVKLARCYYCGSFRLELLAVLLYQSVLIQRDKASHQCLFLLLDLLIFIKL